jgi:hypothetical protein
MAIKKVHLPNGEEIVIDEWLHWPQYSVIEFAAGVSLNLRAFTYVVGQRVPNQGLAPRNATEADTNQVARTRMNHDEAYLAYSLTYEAFALSDAFLDPPGNAILGAPAPAMLSQNLRRLQRDLVIELVVGAGIDKPQFRAPFSWVDQGVGAPAYTSGDGVAAGVQFSYGTAGDISPKSQRRWMLPIFIASDRVFYVKLQSFPGAIVDLTQDVSLKVYLDGLKRRPVA